MTRLTPDLKEIVPSDPTAYTDLTPMPFGKFKGMPMQDVPVQYLHWLFHNANGPEMPRLEPIASNQWTLSKWKNAI